MRVPACPRCSTEFFSELALCPTCLFGDSALESSRVASLQLGEELGRGGMGVVYRAHHAALNRDVAVKVIAADVSRHEPFRRRLEREGRILALLDHPNIVRVFDSGRDGDQLYVVMELVDGRPLSELLPLPVPRAVQLVRQVARALAHAHSRGVVHRDIKPSNIFVSSSGVAKVGDFGIARSLDAAPTTTVTHGDLAVGSPRYMAPEALEGRDPDPRMDVYALGVVLYESVTGTIPAGVFPPIGGPVDAIVRKAMAARPEDRYQRVEDLAAALHRVGANARRARWRLWALAGGTAMVAAAGVAITTQAESAEVTFRQGVDGYAGVTDDWFGPSAHQRSGHATAGYLMTGAWGDVNQQTVLRFGGIFGEADGQIPLAAEIQGATLSFTVPFDIHYAKGEANAVHMMLVDWSRGDTWAAPPWAGGATPGIDRDDIEATARAFDTSVRFTGNKQVEGGIIPTGTTIELDVAPIVAAWAGGKPNYGFLLQSLGGARGESLFFASSRWHDPSTRPELRVSFRTR